ncbi:hypothetical protein [Catenulispora sp. GAS73]|uniref:hypothetical protein n=1 Tax=Catenulispora sp. GAS73 TaxID=3156269 RepID=UPI003517CD6C
MTSDPQPATGPPIVSPTNPRYTAAMGPGPRRAAHRTGSHIWNILHDGPGPSSTAEAEQLDFVAYLRFLTERGHNFIRLWRWEQFRSEAASCNCHFDMSPQPRARTGAGTAKDGKPRFDLDQVRAGAAEAPCCASVPQPRLSPVRHRRSVRRAEHRYGTGSARPPHGAPAEDLVEGDAERYRAADDEVDCVMLEIVLSATVLGGPAQQAGSGLLP